MKDYLEIREINGYSIQYAPFHPVDQSKASIECLVYIGLPDNPQFMGVQEPQKLAEHIFHSKGPSGENKEYLFMLAKALDDLGDASRDKHIEDLADRVRRLEARSESEVIEEAVQGEVKRIRSGQSHGQLEELENAR